MPERVAVFLSTWKKWKKSVVQYGRLIEIDKVIHGILGVHDIGLKVGIACKELFPGIHYRTHMVKPRRDSIVLENKIPLRSVRIEFVFVDFVFKTVECEVLHAENRKITLHSRCAHVPALCNVAIQLQQREPWQATTERTS